MTSLDDVLDVLAAAGFHRLDTPLMIGGSAFDFDAALVATGHAQDLVIVAGGATEHLRAAEMLSGMNRALDMLESRRSVTLVLLGDPPSREILRRIQDSTRLLVVRDTESAEEIRDSLAVLLPLSLPEASSSSAAPLDGLTERLGATDPDVEGILDAASSGTEAVREAMRGFIEEAFENDDEAGSP